MVVIEPQSSQSISPQRYIKLDFSERAEVQLNYVLQLTWISIRNYKLSNPVGTVPLRSLQVKCISLKNGRLLTQVGISPV